MNQTEIQNQAKQILDKFAKALEKIEKQSSEDSYVNRKEFERNENPKPKSPDEDFKKRILNNAPKSNKDFILVEKGSWK